MTQVITSPTSLRELLQTERTRGLGVGFVPTMGALHDGHLSLVRKSLTSCDLTVTSIFVNPLQFGPSEDFTRYPRTLEQDRALLESEGVHFLYAPAAESMYPPSFQSTVEVERLSDQLEGAIRPGHFRGVATVVLKLLNQVGSCDAFFGEKDYQQLQIIRRMVVDLDVPVKVRACETVREPDGLALSSRNRYLSAEQRKAAPAIYAALREAADSAAAGERDAHRLLERASRRLTAEPLLKPQYIAVVDAETLEPLRQIDRPARVLAGVLLGPTRLIDNVALG